MPERQLVCVTNIPNPYRLYEFERLAEELKRRGMSFEVVFLAKTEPGRHWTLDPDQHNIKIRVAPGIHPHLGIFAFHFNPGVLLEMLRNPPTWLLMGGGWNIPTVTALAFIMRQLRPRCRTLFWVEATTSYTAFSRQGWKRNIRRWALSLYDAFVVPGQSSVDYLRSIIKDQSKPILKLANFVDENEYGTRVNTLQSQRAALRAHLGIKDERVFLWPARLIPEKGILEFLEAIWPLRGKEFKILLAGDGPLRQSIQEHKDERGLAFLTILGHQTTERLLELYALADVLLLPSPREPYGFVAVEALFAGLPLLLATTVGAAPEVLLEGQNGWSFNCHNPAEALRVMEQALSISCDRLSAMALVSKHLAEMNFDSAKATRSFVDHLTTLD